MSTRQAFYHSDSASQRLPSSGFEPPACVFHLTRAPVEHHISDLAEPSFHCSLLDIAVLQQGKGPKGTEHLNVVGASVDLSSLLKGVLSTYNVLGRA